MLSLWLKVPYTLFVLVLVPIYAVGHGPANFLWFSDVALLVICLALWLESCTLASMMAVGTLVPELAWVIDFFYHLLVGRSLLGIAGYMFEAQEPLYLRALSLFHLTLPPIMLWLLYRLGYDPRAFVYQVIATWILLLATYWLTKPADNINWVFGPGREPQAVLPPAVYLMLMMLGVPALVIWPTHQVLKWLFSACGPSA